MENLRARIEENGGGKCCRVDVNPYGEKCRPRHRLREGSEDYNSETEARCRLVVVDEEKRPEGVLCYLNFQDRLRETKA